MIKKLGILLFVLAIISAPVAFGQGSVAGSNPDCNSGGVIDLGCLNPFGKEGIDVILARLLKIGATIAMVIMPFIVLWGAYQIMTAGGDPKRFQNGGKTILYASIGFIIALLAENLVSILIDALKGVTS